MEICRHHDVPPIVCDSKWIYPYGTTRRHWRINMSDFTLRFYEIMNQPIILALLAIICGYRNGNMYRVKCDRLDYIIGHDNVACVRSPSWQAMSSRVVGWRHLPVCGVKNCTDRITFECLFRTPLTPATQLCTPFTPSTWPCVEKGSVGFWNAIVIMLCTVTSWLRNTRDTHLIRLRRHLHDLSSSK